MAKKKSIKVVAGTDVPPNLNIKLKISKDKTLSRSKIIVTVQLLSGEEVISSDTDFILL